MPLPKSNAPLQVTSTVVSVERTPVTWLVLAIAGSVGAVPSGGGGGAGGAGGAGGGAEGGPGALAGAVRAVLTFSIPPVQVRPARPAIGVTPFISTFLSSGAVSPGRCESTS